MWPVPMWRLASDPVTLLPHDLNGVSCGGNPPPPAPPSRMMYIHGWTDVHVKYPPPPGAISHPLQSPPPRETMTSHPVPVMQIEHVQRFKVCYFGTHNFFTVLLDPHKHLRWMNHIGPHQRYACFTCVLFACIN